MHASQCSNTATSAPLELIFKYLSRYLAIKNHRLKPRDKLMALKSHMATPSSYQLFEISVKLKYQLNMDTK